MAARFSAIFAVVIGIAVVAAIRPAAARIGSCDEPILLGTTVSETGVFSTLADKWRRMTEMFAKEVNKDGGIMLKSCGKKVPIKFVIYDDQSVPATAVLLYEKMATVDKVDFLVGPDWSSFGGPVPPVAEKHKIPMVAANISVPSLFDRNLKYFWATPSTVVSRWSERYFDMLENVNPKPKSIFFVVLDNPVMKGIAGYWSKKAEAQGLKIVGNQTFSPELKDFTPLIAKMRAAKADIIYIASFDNASVPLVQQMRQLKVHAMDVHHTTLSGSLARQVKNDIEGMTGELAWYPGVKGDYEKFTETVLEDANISMFDYIFTLGRFNSYLVMIQAIEKAGGVDREKVREALYKGTFKSPSGDIVFDERGFPNTGAFTIQIQEGAVKVVWPPEVATGKLQWPSPSWQ